MSWATSKLCSWMFDFEQNIARKAMCSVLSFYLLWSEKVRNKIKQRCPDWFCKVLPPEFCCLVEAGVLDETLCTRVSSIMADRWLHFRSTQAYLSSAELLGSQCHDSERPESPSQRVPEETPRIFDLGQAPVLSAWLRKLMCHFIGSD